MRAVVRFALKLRLYSKVMDRLQDALLTKTLFAQLQFTLVQLIQICE